MLERFTPRRVVRRGRGGRARSSPRWPRSSRTRSTRRSSRCAAGEIELGFVHKGLDDFMHKLDVLANRLVIALVVTGGLIGSSLIGIFAKTGPHAPRAERRLRPRLRRSPGVLGDVAPLGRRPLRPDLTPLLKRRHPGDSALPSGLPRSRDVGGGTRAPPPTDTATIVDFADVNA